jgi:hypothetical protein
MRALNAPQLLWGFFVRFGDETAVPVLLQSDEFISLHIPALLFPMPPNL